MASEDADAREGDARPPRAGGERRADRAQGTGRTPREGGRTSNDRGSGAPRRDARPRGGTHSGGTAGTSTGGKSFGGSGAGGKSFGGKSTGDKSGGGRSFGGNSAGGRGGAGSGGGRSFGGNSAGGRGGAGSGGGGYRGGSAGREGASDRASRPPERLRESGPELPDDITAKDLPAAARNELKTLSKENAEEVARHLAMAVRLIDDDPALAHAHALAATRRAGRIAIVRETAAITAYGVGDFALALREIRTYRRISGRDDQIALIVDSERGVGRPDRALEEGRSVDRSSLAVEARVELAIAMSGARLDRGETELALQELDIPELDPDRAFEWSPALFAARAAVLEELGRDEEAATWRERADVAADALDAASGIADLEVLIVEETEDPDVGDLDPPGETDVETDPDTDAQAEAGTAEAAPADPEGESR